MSLLEDSPSCSILRTQDKLYDEILALGPSRAVVKPGQTPIDEVTAAIAVDDLPAADWKLNRGKALALIDDVIADAWAANGVPDVRASGLRTLRDFATSNALLGSKDWGLGAAMRDLAGEDLDGLLTKPLPASVGKRSPLLPWAGPLHDAFYKVPVQAVRQADVPTHWPEPVAQDWIASVSDGPLTAPIYIRERDGDTLWALFHGALDRTKVSLPYFSMVNTFEKQGVGPSMTFSDPTLGLDGAARLTWFLGTESIDLPVHLAQAIRAHAESHGLRRVVLVGSSGGGFAALQVSRFMPEALTVVFNPQTVLASYIPNFFKAGLRTAFGVDVKEELPVPGSRINAVEAFREIGFARDIRYIQNLGDKSHVRHQLAPFEAAFTASENKERLEVIRNNIGPGHRAQSPTSIVAQVQQFLKRWEPSQDVTQPIPPRTA